MVVPWGNQARGFVLRRAVNDQARRRSGAVRAQMCSWCGFVHRNRGTAMFSRAVDGTDGRKTIGLSLCRSLDCSLRIRNLTGDVPAFMPETLDLEQRIRRLQWSIDAWANRVSPTEYSTRS